MGSNSAQEHLRVLKVVGGFVPCSEDRVQVGKSSGHISVYMIKKKKSMCHIKNRCDSSVTCQAEGNPSSCHINSGISNKWKGEGRALIASHGTAVL